MFQKSRIESICISIVLIFGAKIQILEKQCIFKWYILGDYPTLCFYFGQKKSCVKFCFSLQKSKKVAHCYSYHRFLRAPLLLSRETWTSLDFCTKGGRPAVKFGAQNSRRMWHFWHLMHGCSRCGCERCKQKCLIALEAYLKPLKNFSTLVKEFAMFTRSVAQEALTKLGIHQSHALENRNAEWNFRRCYCGKIIRSQIFHLAWVYWVLSTNWYLWLSFRGLNLSFL